LLKKRGRYKKKKCGFESSKLIIASQKKENRGGVPCTGKKETPKQRKKKKKGYKNKGGRLDRRGNPREKASM